VIEKILPAVVSCDETFSDAPDAVLFPEEMSIMAKAVDKRRREFATARRCARNALGRLGVAAVPIPAADGGAPQWPPGVVGSITHCTGYRAAAVACICDIATVGVDAEPNDRLSDGVLGMVSHASERAQISELVSAIPDVCWDRLLFSAKESVYKALFPLTRRWLGFDEAAITIGVRDGTFDARLLVRAFGRSGRPVTGFAGRWLVTDGLILTAIAVPAVNQASPATRPAQPEGRLSGRGASGAS
jgi:4'-phosphopantetheinyl transferase EntD